MWTQAPFTAGDFVVVQDRPGDDSVSCNFAAEVVACSWSATGLLNLTLKKKIVSDMDAGPFVFTGPDLELTIDHALVTLAFDNSVYVDQYKVLYGHPDMRWGERQFFVRAKHSQCGDMMFGRIVLINNSRFTFGGVVAAAKRKQWDCCLLPCDRQSGIPIKLLMIPLTKSVTVSPEMPPKFGSDEDIKFLISELKRPLATPIAPRPPNPQPVVRSPKPPASGRIRKQIGE